MTRTSWTKENRPHPTGFPTPSTHSEPLHPLPSARSARTVLLARMFCNIRELGLLGVVVEDETIGIGAEGQVAHCHDPKVDDHGLGGFLELVWCFCSRGRTAIWSKETPN